MSKPSKRRRDKSRKKQQTLEAVLGNGCAGASSSPAPAPARSTPRPARADVRFLYGARANISVSDDSDDDVLVVTKAKPASPPRSSKKRKERVISDDDDEDDDCPVLTKKRKARAVSDDEEDDDSPAVATPAHAKQRRRVRINVISDDEDNGSKAADDGDSDSDVRPSTAKRRRLVRKLSPSRSSSPAPTPSRLRGSQKSQREMRMELLRRRRNGEEVTELEQIAEPSDEDEDQVALYDTDPEMPALSEFEDDEEDDLVLALATKKSKKTKKATKPSEQDSDGSGSEDSLDDFIDDEDGLIGAPDIGLMDIPLEFTAHAHKPLREYFKIAVDWLVQRRINPAFEKNDPMYRMAWRKLNDEYRGLAESKFSSAVWTVAFQKSLRARPYIDNYPTAYLGDDHDTCEACNRSGHPATRIIRFSGAPYYENTLETVDKDDSSSDSDSEADSQPGSDSATGGGRGGDRDAHGNTIAPDGKDWYCGVVCAGNAETAHRLYHWKYMLKDFIDEQLRKEGLLAPEELAKRELMSSKKRGKIAARVMDHWGEQGLVKALYGDFTNALKEAQNKSTTGGRVKGR